MREFYYLVASLPMLEFGMKAPFPYSDFLSRCQDQLSTRDMEIIKRTTIAPSEDTEDPSPILREWKDFDTSLRNEIARSRAIEKGKEAIRYIRGEDSPNPFSAVFAHWAISQDSPIEAESYLDRIRWERIEDLAKGHYFDIDYLITYALKLQILERWDRINSSEGMQVLQELVAA